MPPILEVRGLEKRFGDTPVLRGVDLSVEPGECVGLIGPSGCGKSTLLRCLNQLEAADGGTVRVGELTATPGRPLGRADLQRLRREAGMVFQQFHLFPHRTALENVMEGPRHVLGRPRAEALETARRLLEKVGLGGHLDRRPAALSGGQQQRVAIARALALQPSVLLLDEPTSALDPELREEVREVLVQLGGDGLARVLVTHDMELARRSADRVLFLDGGRIVESGPADAFFAGPRTERAREFLRRARH